MTQETQPREIEVSINLNRFSPPEQLVILALCRFTDLDYLQSLTPSQTKEMAGGIPRYIDRLLKRSKGRVDYQKGGEKEKILQETAGHFEVFGKKYQDIKKATGIEFIDERALFLLDRNSRKALSSITGENCHGGRITLNL